MNLYYLDKKINGLASKHKRTSAEQTRLCELLQDAEAAGCKIRYDKDECKYYITGGNLNG